MKIIFEDNKKDVLCQLYNVSYSSDVIQRDFIFAEGNSKALKKAIDILRNSDEDVVLFLDMPPGNVEANKIYKELKREGDTTTERLIVMPIPCFEYYFILSIYNKNWMFTRTDGIKACVNKEYFRNESILETDEDRKYATTFERYCKLILKKSVIDCVKHCNMSNGYYGLYYTQDCLCNKNMFNECIAETLKDKSNRMVLKFPCFPKGNNIGKSVGLNKTQLWKIHDTLVEDYNKMVQLYIEKSGSSEERIGRYTLKYKEIRKFKHG